LQQVLDPELSYGKEFTYGDYLTWQFDEMVEIIKGKVYKMSPAPGSVHQQISSNIHGELYGFLKSKRCRVFSAPYDVILPIDNKKRETATTVVQPDLCVICDLTIIEERGCFGIPDLMIEILSPHTSKKDLYQKFEIYEEVGVPEYWIVMPKEQSVEIFILESKKYKRQGTYSFEDAISTHCLPGFSLQLADVFEKKNIL